MKVRYITLFFKDKKSKRKFFYYYFCLLIEGCWKDPDPYLWLTNPDPGGPKHGDPDSDPEHWYLGSGFSESGSRFRIFGWIAIQIRTKNYRRKKNLLFFFIKNGNYLSLGLHNGRPSFRRSLQPSKENIQHFKTWNLLTFSIFVGHFSDPDPKHWFASRY